MKLRYITLVLAAGLFASCEKEVNVDLPEEEPFLVVDAWLTNDSSNQEITLSYIRPYLDNNAAPVALGAQVQVFNTNSQDTIRFTDEDGDGRYSWNPQEAGRLLGQEGDQFVLNVDFQGVNYSSQTVLFPVPQVDSITFEYTAEDAFITQDYYIGEFWARDLEGPGNTYWIKAWKNGVFLNKPSEINIAYDASFSDTGDAFDAKPFISPIRTSINPVDEVEDDQDGQFLPTYLPNDTAYVEIHSISNEAWFFLGRVVDETDVGGGFAALFATPLSNVPTNITSSNPENRVVGFFNVASVSSLEQIVNDESIRDNIAD